LICAVETFESRNNWRPALRALAKWLRVWHVLVGMKMLGFSDDVLGKLTDITHERVTRELAMLDFTKAKFPFAGQLRAGQFGHGAFQEHNCLDRLRCGLKFLALSCEIMS